MAEEKIVNARIGKVSLSMADHGALTYYIPLEIGKGSFCAIGGRVIGHGYLGADEFEGSAIGLEAMMRIMDTVGVEKWEDLDGKLVRVVDTGWGGRITKIGNILEDKWFDDDEFYEKELEKRKP